MKVQCVICDAVETIESRSIEAKRLKNRQIQTYLCQSCYNRIRVNTLKRHETGQFSLYQSKEKSFLPDGES